MAEEKEETDRVTVKTYVPRDQKEVWKAHADDLGMSQSEFVRTMVQAGRRDFDLDPEKGGSGGATPGGKRLGDQILDVLERNGPLDYEELVGALIGDFEEQLDAVLGELQEENRIRYSGRQGGYTRHDE